MSNTIFEVEVQKNEQDELFIELPPSLMKELGWKPGDELKWEETDNGGFRCRKIKYETIELEIDDEEYVKYLKFAHENNMSFNEFVELAISEVVKQETK